MTRNPYRPVDPSTLTAFQRECLRQSAAALDAGDETTAAAFWRVANITTDQRQEPEQ